MGLTILNTKLSSTLREARVRKGLSPEAMASKLHLSLEELSGAESNPVRTPLRILVKVIEGYNSEDAIYLVSTASRWKYPPNPPSLDK